VWSGEKWVCNFWFCERQVRAASKRNRPKDRSATSKKARKRR
jgi:hypothetical protein